MLSVLTRRQLMGAAGTGAGTALIAACGGDGGAPRDARGEARARDLKLVGSALDLENTVIAAYSAGEPLLRGAALRAAQELAEQERAHAERLTRAVEELGGRPNPPKTSEEYTRAFPRLREQDDVLRFAVDLENAALRFYLESLPKLRDPRLRQLAASIAASEAQHASVLRGELGREQVPDAFATGRSQAG